MKEAKPAEPVKEAKPAEPVKEAKPAEPVKEAKPAEPVKEAKPAEPVKELVVKEPSVKIDTKTFKSSISSADDNITEVIIKDKEEGGSNYFAYASSSTFISSHNWFINHSFKKKTSSINVV